MKPLKIGNYEEHDKNGVLDLIKHAQKRKKKDFGDKARNSKMKIYSCKICDKTFINSKKLNNHNEIHITKQCVLCKREFKFPTYRKHRLKCKLYSCQICNFETRLRPEFRKHKNQHKENSFDCQICNYSTYRVSNFQRHNMLHFHSSKLECDICGKEFRELEKHKERRHSPKVKERKDRKLMEKVFHKCGYCDYKSSIKRNLKVHIVRKHTNPKPSRHSNQNNTCQKCNVTFTRPNYCKLHEVNCQG